jgi:RNA polymerase sigma-70 factor (ECF subfamily)
MRRSGTTSTNSAETGDHIREERLLLEAARNGDTTAFEQLSLKHERLLYYTACGILANTDLAADVVQTTYLRAFEKLHQFRGESKFSSWMVSIATRESLDVLQRMRRVVSLDKPSDTVEGEPRRWEAQDWSASPELLYSQAELRAILKRCIERLRPTLRAVFVLRDIQEISIAETSAALGITIANTKTRLMRARQQLRLELSAYLGRPAGCGVRRAGRMLRVATIQRAESQAIVTAQF